MELSSKPKGKQPVAANASVAVLVILFWVWKCLLLSLVVLSPGPGYDTSTQVLLTQHQPPSRSGGSLASALERVVSRLTRWDAFYFTTSSARGHLHEQEWAFSWVQARYTSAIVGVFPFLTFVSLPVRHGTVGIVLSHLSHLCAVLVLFRLTYEVVPSDHRRKRQIAFTAACLHIVSPAGVFLSAHYAESSCALFNFLGMLSYTFAIRRYQTPGISAALRGALWTLASGVSFGQAATLRSNGLLSGVIFAWDALLCLPELPNILVSPDRLIRLGATILSGIILAVAFATPQLVAYLEYCTAGNTRPWCERLVPSIYTWVQDHYWNVGFLRYWTLSNLPLFVLAAPSVLMLISSAVAVFQGHVFPLGRRDYQPPSDSKVLNREVTVDGQLFHHVMPRFALPQAMIAAMAVTSFHTQTINRISSGYPVWYMVLAVAIHDSNATSGGIVLRYLRANAQLIVKVMVMYAIIQGGLFASFLPPA